MLRSSSSGAVLGDDEDRCHEFHGRCQTSESSAGAGSRGTRDQKGIRGRKADGSQRPEHAALGKSAEIAGLR